MVPDLYTGGIMWKSIALFGYIYIYIYMLFKKKKNSLHYNHVFQITSFFFLFLFLLTILLSYIYDISKSAGVLFQEGKIQIIFNPNRAVAMIWIQYQFVA